MIPVISKLLTLMVSKKDIKLNHVGKLLRNTGREFLNVKIYNCEYVYTIKFDHKCDTYFYEVNKKSKILNVLYRENDDCYTYEHIRRNGYKSNMMLFKLHKALYYHHVTQTI